MRQITEKGLVVNYTDEVGGCGLMECGKPGRFWVLLQLQICLNHRLGLWLVPPLQRAQCHSPDNLDAKVWQ